MTDSSTYQPVSAQEKYPPNYYPNSDDTSQSQREEAQQQISDEERDKLKREELLRIYDLYKRHSLKESLDSIREKVNGLLESKYTRSNLQEEETGETQNSDSDIGVLALRRAVTLLKESIKQRSNSDSNYSGSDSNLSPSGLDRKSVDPKSDTNIKETNKIPQEKKKGIELSGKPVKGREEIAIPVYSQSEEEEKKSTQGKFISVFCFI